MTKSKLASVLSILTWAFLYFSFIIAIGDPHPESPPSVYETKDFIFRSLIIFAGILFLLSTALSILGYNKDKKFSIFTLTVHICFIFWLMYGL